MSMYVHTCYVYQTHIYIGVLPKLSKKNLKIKHLDTPSRTLLLFRKCAKLQGSSGCVNMYGVHVSGSVYLRQHCYSSSK